MIASEVFDYDENNLNRNHETAHKNSYESDLDKEHESESEEDPELSYYQSLLKGNEFYLDENVGLDPIKATCITSNQSGTFLVTGSVDGTVRCINFDKWAKGGFGDFWKNKLEQSVNGLCFNTEESVLAVASGNMLHFYTDGGDLIVSTTKGDMYLLDAKKTKGHTAAVTCVANDPKNSNLFASGSLDGTVRVFDIQSNRQSISLSVNNLNIYTLSNKYLSRNKTPNNAHLGQKAKMNRVGISSLCYSSNNFKDVLVAGNDLGFLVVWDQKTAFQSMYIESHDSSVHSVLSYDDGKVVSQSNGCIKFWDLKNTQKPLKELNLPQPNDINETQTIVLSPDNLHLIMSSSNTQNNKMTELHVFDIEKMEIVNKLTVDSLLGPMVWAYETNQLFSVCSDGKIYTRSTESNVGANHYDRALRALEKKNKYSKVNTFSAKPESYPIDYLPDDLVEVEDGVLKKRRVEHHDKYGIPKQEGYDYFKHGKTPITYEDDDIVTKLRSQVEKDPNKELTTKEGIRQIPYKADRFMSIYKKTQPNLILDFNKPATKQENMLLGVSKCPRCGIKICQCGYMDKR
ncbi:uncharacterized protein TA08040 [Theileria annulata]|uniref:Uncharacterized protein n=1 Tax=Theileria annulata TaxID=5874 RepID=Q4U9U9_THEAN|nr:uncharacterized protein TA08040 [Theileria annulata]CAI76404.1 hypothetical protein, conserved [Theileria annulata]|eukprot:XP_953029.1 hypothetical protein, conserved [Theileria annulata]